MLPTGDKVIEGSGYWKSKNSWVPSTQCEGYSSRLPFHDILRCLAGRVLIIEGDSVARQVYLRLVWWLRGLPVIIENANHQHSLYTFNRSSDSLRVLAGNACTSHLFLTSIASSHLRPPSLTARRQRHAQQLQLAATAALGRGVVARRSAR